MNADILILGATSQLAYDLQKLFSKLGISYIALSKDQVNALDINLIDQLNAYANVKYVINCMAVTNVDLCEDNPNLAMQINSSAIYFLAIWAKQHNITLIHFSTDYVFDGLIKKQYTEYDNPNPINVYGISKYAGDLSVIAYANKYFIFRVAALFGVAGSSGKGGNFVTTMLKLARNNPCGSINVINDQYTTPTHTLDIARCIAHFIVNQIDDYGIYNCVSNNCCSWYEFSQHIMSLSNLDSNIVKPINYLEYKFKAKRPQYVVLSESKLQKYYKMPSWDYALTEYLELI